MKLGTSFTFIFKRPPNITLLWSNVGKLSALSVQHTPNVTAPTIYGTRYVHSCKSQIVKFLPNITMTTVVPNFNSRYNQRHICSIPVRYHILMTGFSIVPANNDTVSLARQYIFRHLLVVLYIHRTTFRDVPTSEGVHSVSVFLFSVFVSQ